MPEAKIEDVEEFLRKINLLKSSLSYYSGISEAEMRGVSNMGKYEIEKSSADGTLSDKAVEINKKYNEYMRWMRSELDQIGKSLENLRDK